MRAYRYDAFGPVSTAARLTDVAQPRPAPGELLVRVRHVSINPLDWKLVEGQYRLLAKSRPPCGIGCEFSGIVEAHGRGVSTPAIGTPVVGYLNPMARPPGALQEFVALAARDIMAIDAADMEDACTLPVAGISALQMCRLAEVGSGKRVLVHGAAGGVGSFAVQIVRALGALPYATGSRESQPTLALLEPQARINYTSQAVASWGGPFDAVLDCASTLGSSDVATLLAAGGRYVRTLPALPGMLLDPLLNAFRPVKRYTLRLAPSLDDLRTLINWLRRGRIKPLITERFAFADALAALEQSKGGRARGKLVVRLG
jgi:NADPH:quinone reductase-like Zn-dependent oxidoreductase